MMTGVPACIPIQTGSETILPEGFLLGHAQNTLAATGCTAIICKEGAVAGVSVRGAAPATRETDLLDPRNTVERINAVFLSGGSAFGLDAAAGIMRWLAEQDLGFRVGAATVPIVCGACIFDLGIGASSAHPDAEDGYAACENATTAVTTGNVGAGTGASVGKLLGESFAMKSGFGAASARFGELIVTAVVTVNALGHVFDRSTGQMLAGTRDPQAQSSILDPYQAFSLILGAGAGAEVPAHGENTTIGCVLTNGILAKAQATRVADMTHDGFARAIEPAHTGFDGDAMFALSTATIPTTPDLLGALGALVTEAAIHDAIRSATTAYGLPSANELTEKTENRA
jgi:L-aminopeptidase/D-esterase-like protein